MVKIAPNTSSSQLKQLDPKFNYAQKSMEQAQMFDALNAYGNLKFGSPEIFKENLTTL